MKPRKIIKMKWTKREKMTLKKWRKKNNNAENSESHQREVMRNFVSKSLSKGQGCENRFWATVQEGPKTFAFFHKENLFFFSSFSLFSSLEAQFLALNCSNIWRTVIPQIFFNKIKVIVCCP